MPSKMKCDSCNKLRTDTELCGDDRLCRPCEVRNAAELARIRCERASAQKSGDVPKKELNEGVSGSLSADLYTENELLAYTSFYRDRANSEALRLHYWRSTLQVTFRQLRKYLSPSFISSWAPAC